MLKTKKLMMIVIVIFLTISLEICINIDLKIKNGNLKVIIKIIFKSLINYKQSILKLSYINLKIYNIAK